MPELRQIEDESIFLRDHWPHGVRTTSMPLRMFWVRRNDPGFRFTEPELAVLRRAQAGEDVGIRFLTPEKAGAVLRLYGEDPPRPR